MEIIKTDKLTKIYRKTHLFWTKETLGVKDLDLVVNEGEIFTLLGLNGTGKTTTIKLILGLLFPTSGSIHVCQTKMPDDDVRQNIGYLPELPYFYRNLTPSEVLDLYSNLSGMNKKSREQRIPEVLDIVRMSKFKDKRMSEFSKGMLQRIGIAQSLLHNPKLLVFDEPIAGLDPIGIHEMRQLLIDLKTQGKTIMYSSHIISEAEKISDRVGILVNGKLAGIYTQKDWVNYTNGLEQIFIDIVGKDAPPR